MQNGFSERFNGRLRDELPLNPKRFVRPRMFVSSLGPPPEQAVFLHARTCRSEDSAAVSREEKLRRSEVVVKICVINQMIERSVRHIE